MIVEINKHKFNAVFEIEKSPKTCNSFKKLLPYNNQAVHVRWSGEGMWIPLGDFDLGVQYEDATMYPSPGQIIFYPKGKSETEILIAYGSVAFGSKAGPLAGNHFATINSDLNILREIGISTMWEGAKPISFK